MANAIALTVLNPASRRDLVLDCDQSLRVQAEAQYVSRRVHVAVVPCPALRAHPLPNRQVLHVLVPVPANVAYLA